MSESEMAISNGITARANSSARRAADSGSPAQLDAQEIEGRHYRILAVADLWQGSDAYGYVRAFRRMGHSVRTVPAEHYVPGYWKRRPLRLLRRLFEPIFVREYAEALVEEAVSLQPHLFFVFKGRYVLPQAIHSIQSLGAVCMNVYPDVSFTAHGKYIPQALPLYDWVITTKSYGIEDMRRLVGVTRSSFLPHGYDPETHRPVPLDDEDKRRYACDVSFIGTWSPKKQRLLEQVRKALPEVDLRVWGCQWEKTRPTLGSALQGTPVLGLEYAKAIRASRINICILSEARAEASSQDLITSRTFHIPAAGGFLLHEYTGEFATYFEEGKECACFRDPEELVGKIQHYLAHPEEREEVAAAGRRRSVDADYSVDHRARQVLKKAGELLRESAIARERKK